MARDFSGTSQYGQCSRDFSAYSTLVVAGWVYFDTKAGGGDYDMIWELTADYGANVGSFAFYYQGTGDTMVVAHKGNVGLSAATAGTLATGVWTHWVTVYDFTVSTNEVNIYRDGALQTVDRSTGNNNNTGAFANSTFNLGGRNAASLFTDGKIERVGIWSADIGADAIVSLSRGVDPLRVRPDKLINYWPLWGNDSPEPDYVGNNNLTITGATQAAGPSANRPFDGANWWPGAFTASGAATTTPKLIGGNLIRPNLVRGRLAA